MTITAVLLLTSTCLYAGFQWTIRILVYPQFASVPAEAFAGYERAHQRRTATAVGPLFVFAGGAAIGAFAARPDLASAVAAGCVASVVLITAVAAVPQHRRLLTAFDSKTLDRLLLIDSVRLAFAVVGCAAAVVYAIAD